MSTSGNEKIRVEYSDSSGLAIYDLRFGGVWKSIAPFRMTYGDAYSYNLAECCCVSVTTENNVMRFRLNRMEFFGRFCENPYRKPDPGPELEFEFAIEIKGDTLCFTSDPVKNLDDEPLRLCFPYGLLAIPSADAGQAILPCGYGGLFRLPRKDLFSIDLRYLDHYTAMPLFGLLRQTQPGLAIRLLNYTDQATRFSINREHLDTVSFDIQYDVIANMANDARKILVRICPPGTTYNELAKWYRSCLMQEKRFVTYREKIARSAEAEKLVGSVIWKHSTYARQTPQARHTYSLYMTRPNANEVEGLPGNWSAYEVFDTAHSKGFDRVCIYNTGWNFMGFDSGYPVRWPPNPERGTPEEFRAAAEYGRSLSPDYIFSIHDNYLDTYRNSPDDCTEDLVKDQHGVPCLGGIWRGGRARTLCSATAMKYARRDIPRIVELLGRGSIYTDVYGCTKLNRCYDARHPMSEHEELEFRREVMRYQAEQFGTVATEGTPSDFFADTVHLGAFTSIWPLCSNSIDLAEPALPIPLWQLVYHDSVLNYTCEAAYGPQGSAYLAFQALYNLLPSGFDEKSLELSKKLRRTYTCEMLSHEFVGEVRSFKDPDGLAAIAGKVRTSFADGTVVEAEFHDNSNAQYRIIQR